MKSAIEWSIRAFWGFFGTLCGVGLVQMVWGQIFRHQAAHGMLSLFIVVVSMIMALVAFVGYLAIFRFSSLLIRPTVLIVSLILWFTASWGIRVYLQPAIERDVQLSNFSVMPFIGLAAMILSIVGAIGFYRATSRILERRFGGTFSARLA